MAGIFLRICFTYLIYDPIAKAGFFSLDFNSVGYFVFYCYSFISVCFTTYLTFAVNSFSYFIFSQIFYSGFVMHSPCLTIISWEDKKIRSSELYVAERWRGDKTRGSKTGWEVWAGAAVNGRLSFELSEIRGTSWVAVC